MNLKWQTSTQHFSRSTEAPLAPVRVFVYGTLKPGYQYYPRYCAGRVIAEQPAQVQGQLFDLPLGYPGMTVGGQWVQGYVLSFKDDSVLTDLDALEDYHPHRSRAENLYNREWVEVFSPNGLALDPAWVYRMATETVIQLGGTWIPSGEWRA